MSVLIYAESFDGKFKKAGLEAVSYGSELAKMMNTDAVALAINADDASELAKYGANKVINISNEELKKFSSNVFADAVKSVADSLGTKVIVMTMSSNTNSFSPSLSIKWDATLVSGVYKLPQSVEPLVVERKVFSNKASAAVEATKERAIILISQNSHGLVEHETSIAAESFEYAAIAPKVSVENVEMASGKVNLMDAEIVVSAGRGLKAPENWNIIEELAETLGAGTACSKPVSDIGWRPHSEHVGQTGKQIAPNLYFAIGISGAIQHVAGINNSKVIVAINTDDEAPIFKAADYGIVGDAFKIVPELNEKIKNLKG
jgi:electron transfer flavoprotein alpha subunit